MVIAAAIQFIVLWVWVRHCSEKEREINHNIIITVNVRQV